MTYRVGIDIGGTFTDFAMLKGDEVVLHKNLSTPEDRSLGAMEGLGKLAAMEGLAPGDFLAACEAIVHGTTVADNTLIEMNGAVTGLITTEGFRDEVEYRRGFKEDIWDVRLAPPKPITPRRRRLTVSERILHDGSPEAGVALISPRTARDPVASAARVRWAWGPAREATLAGLRGATRSQAGAVWAAVAASYASEVDAGAAAARVQAQLAAVAATPGFVERFGALPAPGPMA